MRVATVETEPGIGLTAKSDDIEGEGRTGVGEHDG